MNDIINKFIVTSNYILPNDCLFCNGAFPNCAGVGANINVPLFISPLKLETSCMLLTVGFWILLIFKSSTNSCLNSIPFCLSSVTCWSSLLFVPSATEEY